MIIQSGRRLLIELAPDAEPRQSLEGLGLESLTLSSLPGWIATARSAGPALHPWDEAHRAVQQLESVGLESGFAPAYAEPDLVQAFPYPRREAGGLESFTGSPCEDRGPDDFWPVGDPALGWHLDQVHSQLKAARDRAGDPGDGRRIRVGILDTGYDPAHVSMPLHVLTELQRNFVDGDPNDATDPGRHFPGNNPGHGTATLALLAGRRLAVPRAGFNDFLGGAPFAEVVPIRIADWVVHFYTSAMAQGLEYAIEAGCQVISLSMGGLPARSWATAVNRAYEAGVAIFAAAGNRFGPSPPRSIVYPARFHRVVAVCGATADETPYYRPGLHRHMQGCFGPPPRWQRRLLLTRRVPPGPSWGAAESSGSAREPLRPHPRQRPPPRCGCRLQVFRRRSPRGSEWRPCATRCSRPPMFLDRIQISISGAVS